MLPYLKERIKDSQWEVRKVIVNTFYFILANHLDEVDTDSIRCLIERTIDKRVEVRRWAISACINVLMKGCIQCRLSISISDRSGTKPNDRHAPSPPN